jgi:hypothetical protein
MESLEAARHRTWSQRSPSSCWPADTFDVLCPKVLQIEEIANELSRTLGDYGRVRLEPQPPVALVTILLARLWDQSRGSRSCAAPLAEEL